MNKEGPVLELLTSHLAECPEYFLMEPMLLNAENMHEGTISTSAVVSDLSRITGGIGLSKKGEGIFELNNNPGNRNFLLVVQVAAWLLFHAWFRDNAKAIPGFREKMMELLISGLREHASLVRAGLFVSEPDRREELVRYVLAFLGYRPDGEDESQARDRFNIIDSAEQKRIVEKSREHQIMLEKKRTEEKKRRLEEAERQRKIQEEIDRENESSKVTRD